MAIPVFTLKGDSKDKINFFNRYNDSHWDWGDKSIVFYNRHNYWCMTSKDFWKVILCLNSVDTTSVYHYTSRDYCVLWQVSTYWKHIYLVVLYGPPAAGDNYLQKSWWEGGWDGALSQSAPLHHRTALMGYDKTLKPVTQSLVTIPRSSCCNYGLNIQCDHLSQTCYWTNWCVIGLFKSLNIQSWNS